MVEARGPLRDTDGSRTIRGHLMIITIIRDVNGRQRRATIFYAPSTSCLPPRPTPIKRKRSAPDDLLPPDFAMSRRTNMQPSLGGQHGAQLFKKLRTPQKPLAMAFS